MLSALVNTFGVVMEVMLTQLESPHRTEISRLLLLLLHPSPSPPLRQHARQRNHLIQQRLVLTRRILRHLIPQMVDLQAGRCGRVTLRRLDARDLHFEEELGDFDGEVAADAADAGFGGQVDV